MCYSLSVGLRRPNQSSSNFQVGRDTSSPNRRVHSKRASAFEALADPTRRSIREMLVREPGSSGQGGVSAGRIAGAFKVSRPAISRHLRVLRESGVVVEHRAGRRRLYQLAPEALREVDEWLVGLRLAWAARLIDLKEHLEQDVRSTATAPSPPRTRKELDHDQA